MYRHIQSHAHVTRTETVCLSTDLFGAKTSLCVRTPTQFRAYANTVYRPYLLLLPLYLLLICLLWWILQRNCYWNGFSA